jgi:hypothetical protein
VKSWTQGVASVRRMMGAGRRKEAALIMGRKRGNEKYTRGYGGGMGRFKFCRIIQTDNFAQSR